MSITNLPVGCLVRPREERCVATVRARKTRRYTKVYCGYIKVCSEENRERPIKKSRCLNLEENAVVIEHGGSGRYPMVKLLTSAEGGQWVGWALAVDVELANNAETILSETIEETC